MADPEDTRMVLECIVGLVFALLLGVCGGCFSIFGDVLGHTLVLHVLGIPVTLDTLMAGTPRFGHVELLVALGVLWGLALTYLVGRIVVLIVRSGESDG